jgi:hypothetical protein
MDTLNDRPAATERFESLAEVHWTAPDGGEVRERVWVEEAGRIGLIVCLQDYWKDLFPGCEVTVTHPNFCHSFQARVIEVQSIAGGKLSSVALELLEISQQNDNDT